MAKNTVYYTYFDIFLLGLMVACDEDEPRTHFIF